MARTVGRAANPRERIEAESSDRELAAAAYKIQYIIPFLSFPSSMSFTQDAL